MTVPPFNPSGDYKNDTAQLVSIINALKDIVADQEKRISALEHP